MKKYIVLTVLFVLPIAVYLFFASGVNNFGKLPVLNTEIITLDGLTDHRGDMVRLDSSITVLGFLGSDVGSHKLNAFNLNQKIYKRFNGFENFQMVILLPESSKKAVDTLSRELSGFTDISNWHFVFTSSSRVEEVFNGLKSSYSLDATLYTPYVFIVDKAVRLRGRTEDKDAQGPLYGYDATSVAVLNNKMIDDVKVLLAEYRLALKKNQNGSSRDAYLKYPNKKEADNN